MLFLHLTLCILLVHIVSSNNNKALPTSSEEFLASYSSCDSNEVKLLFDNSQSSSFFRHVLAARHTTWQKGWEVDIMHSSTLKKNAANNDGKYYARVFDLLNWSREHNLLPIPIDISSICHKGMETSSLSGISSDVPQQPNAYIPTEMWDSLWDTCSSKLLSTDRISSSCIDIPGIVVTSPKEKHNNPCNLEYRMVDGAHRLCLRKYLLTLLHGELMELQEKNISTESNDRLSLQIQQKQQLINQTAYGYFLVLDHTTFLSMLINSDPHKSWAKSKEYLMKDITHDVQLDWQQWMERVMDHVEEMKRSEWSKINDSLRREL